jgi:hypothetical protein
MCCLLVSGFFTEITQQIHSLRARGVMSSHCARATESERRTFRKSAGTLCTTPGEIAFFVMDFHFTAAAHSVSGFLALNRVAARMLCIHHCKTGLGGSGSHLDDYPVNQDLC